MTAKVFAFVDRDLRLALSYPSTLFMPFASAVVTVAGFALLARIVNPHAHLDAGAQHIDYFTYVVINLAFMAFLNAALQAVPAAIRRDQVAGTLESMFASPTAIETIVVASMLWPLLFACTQVVTYLVTASFFGLSLQHANVALLLEFAALGCACTSAMGLAAAAAVIAFKQAPPYTILMGTGGTLLAGVLFPISLLPQPLQVVSWMLPLTHALRGLRAAVTGGSLGPVSGDALWLAGATALLLPLSLAALRLAIDRAKTDGSLSSY